MHTSDNFAAGNVELIQNTTQEIQLVAAENVVSILESPKLSKNLNFTATYIALKSAFEIVFE